MHGRAEWRAYTVRLLGLPWVMRSGTIRTPPLLLVSMLMLPLLSVQVCSAQENSGGASRSGQQESRQLTKLRLIPMPREVRPVADLPLPAGVRILCSTCSTDAEDKFAAEDLANTLASRGIATKNPAGLVINLDRQAGLSLPAEGQAEGYEIASTDAGVRVTAASAAGLFYGAQTVKQMIERDASTPTAVLHAANIRDWPAMRYRGLSDDLSRGPITTLAFEKHLIRTLAAYKVNVFSLYFEHTAAYASEPLFAPPGGAVTAADAAALVAFAKPYHVTIIAEQEAFGHLHHNLLWEQYQPLAETPHGAVLAPNQAGSLALSTEMLNELAAEFPGPFLHIGADETVDLGLGQTKAAVDAQGLAPVYLDYLQRVVTSLAPLHRKLLFWGDIAQDAPQDVLNALPASFKQSTIAVAWVYSPEPRGYDRFLKPFRDAGFETWAAPSVNNYRKVYPNNNLALLNIQEFARDAQRLGSTGLLNTIWNDDGEGLINQDWYGILFGAAAGWQAGESSIPQFEDSYAQIFHNDATGKLNQAQRELMAAHSVLKDEAKVGDASNSLFWLDPFSKDGLRINQQVLPHARELRLHAEAALTLIAQARAAAGLRPAATTIQYAAPGTPIPFYDSETEGAASSNLAEPDAVDAMELGARRMDLIGLNSQLAEEIAEGYQRAYAGQAATDRKQRAAVARELSDINGINGRIEDLRDAYSLLRDMYEAAWLRSNRPYALRPVLEHYDHTVGEWITWSDKLRSAQRQYSDTHTLPAASELGLPLPTTMAAQPLPANQ